MNGENKSKLRVMIISLFVRTGKEDSARFKQSGIELIVLKLFNEISEVLLKMLFFLYPSALQKIASHNTFPLCDND